MIRLNLKLEQAFVLVLENILGQSAVTHYNRNSTIYFYSQSEQRSDG